MRKWVNWKHIMTFFALIGTPVPTEKDLGALRVQLSENGQNVTRNEFINNKFWFDEYEGKPDSALEAQWLLEKKAQQELSDYDSEDEENQLPRYDTDRIREIKDLLFDIFRVNTGEDKLSVPEFIDHLIECSSKAHGDTFGSSLFKN